MNKGIWGILLATAFAAIMLTGMSVYAVQGDSKGQPFQELQSLIGASQAVPVGTVLDWWCSTDCTIPEGYQIADGSEVTDPDSPLFGQTLPDLSDRFVKGTTNPDAVGTTGGSLTHSHTGITNQDTHTHAATSSLVIHDHEIDVSIDPHSHEVLVLADHLHEYSPILDGLHGHSVVTEHGHGGVTHPSAEEPIRVQVGDGPLVSPYFHVHGISPEVGMHTSEDGEHDHSAPSRTESAGGDDVTHTSSESLKVDTAMEMDRHTHDIDVPNDSHSHSTTSDIQDNSPEFYTLLKIIRIK